MNKMYVAFKEGDCGCYADGCFGDDHLRDILKGMLKGLNHAELAKVFDDEPSDDGSEYLEALEVLQEYTDEGLTWILEGGDLLLVKESEIR